MTNGAIHSGGPRQPSFIVNFLRDRDSYHVPSALNAHGQLERLVTDIYYPRLPGPMRASGLLRRLRDHCTPLIDARLTVNCYLSALLQVGLKIGGLDREIVFELSDRALDRKTLAVAVKRPDADLLLYSGYAKWTFSDKRMADRRKLLFLFHPHHAIEWSILSADAERFPEGRGGLRAFSTPAAVRRWKHADEELALADGVICASSFSARSVAYAGFDKPSQVVPYFSAFDINERANETRAQGGVVEYLFVGQGIQRKGLHHLLRAWRKAGLRDATLTLVCSRIDPDIADCIPDDVIVKSNLTKDELVAEFDRAHVFVMPSLIEGFGLVYLEALSRGAFVIATQNTGAPDIGLREHEAALIEPGDLDSLAEVLTAVRDRVVAGLVDHSQITDVICRYQFSEYANRLGSAIAGFQGPRPRLLTQHHR